MGGGGGGGRGGAGEGELYVIRIRASNYFKLYLLPSLWIMNHKKNFKDFFFQSL